MVSAHPSNGKCLAVSSWSSASPDAASPLLKIFLILFYPTMSTLNLFQQIHLQSLTANLAGSIVGPESVLQEAMNIAAKRMVKKHLSQYGWDITWGPRVWKSETSKWYEGLNNCWMVMKAPNVEYPDGTRFDTYVVAIAGTTVFSTEDWEFEDFGVDKVVDFNAYTKNFTTGSADKPVGVQNPPFRDIPYGAWGTTFEFRVIFTGHSLGGALSPYLSLATKANNLVPGVADIAGDILALPSAGATPGEQLFSDAYSKLSKGKFLTKIQGLVQKSKDRAKSSGFTYIPIEGSPFNGTPPAETPTNFLSFMSEAVLQHTKAYHNAVNVSDELVDLYKAIISAPGVKKKSARILAKEMPVLCNVDDSEWDDNSDDKYPFDCILTGERVPR
ncbi:uncharacterized protein CLUP02_05021 [Colletotrichum lupini]|uniref:Fungal lipase-like domain-containing protein n=1 Tax=Colletotrichum lupini TaxID=145971 RepID=A0A9Q8SMI3_9PEZI|nr:uncharacterized protein CLUP02_05021 [Colletotrichum lupini]UQC79541.1 hypothetical protein CLUP02_05021 [Colletotrichum lupini]